MRFGDSFVEVIHLDGHTPGSIALYYKDPEGTGHIFTGDSLFPGGHGKTATREHHDALMNDLERKVFGRFDDDTWVYPGHGDDTTLGAERPSAAGVARARLVSRLPGRASPRRARARCGP